MSRRFHKFGLAVLFLGLVFAIGCDDDKPASMTSPSETQPILGLQQGFSVEPAALRAEFLNGISCSPNRAFGTRVIVIISGGNDLRGVRFRFTDRFGFTAFPQVGVLPVPGLMTQPPVSAPTSQSVPPLGAAPLPPTGVSVPFGASQQFPFSLTFGCGPFSQGTLFVSVDTRDRNGMNHSSETRLPLSE